MSASPCFAERQLAAFLEGALPEYESSDVVNHIESCAVCQSVLDTLVNADPITAEIFRADSGMSPRSFHDDPECRIAVERAGELIKRVPVGAEAADAKRWCEPGVIVGAYELGQELGTGGMGVVFAARQRSSRAPVAIKFMDQNIASTTGARRRFQREIEALKRLDHPRLVRFLETGEHDQQAYLVMEYVPGVDLGKVASERGPLPPNDACEIIRQAAEGLAVAHEAGIIHRDVKPSNLMLTESGFVKVLDFGLARFHGNEGRSAAATMTRGMVGTLDYLAPEQAENSHAIDGRADVFSLGAALYRLLAGQAPFDSRRFPGQVQQLRALTSEAPRPLSQWRPDLPADLCELVSRMLELDPAKRPASMRDVLLALEPFAVGHDLPTLAQKFSVPPPFPQASRISRSRGPATQNRWLLIGGLGMAAFAAVIVILLRADDRPAESKQAKSRPSSSASVAHKTLAASATKASPTAPATRNPFGVTDVPDPQGEDVQRFESIAWNWLPGDERDENAEGWPTHSVGGQLDSLDGGWASRWKCDRPNCVWHPGTSRVRVVADQLFVLHQDLRGADYLIEARRAGDRLVGRYVNLARIDRVDAFPWYGRIVDSQRIDGVWVDHRGEPHRWDLRRQLAALPRPESAYLRQVTPGIAGRFLGHQDIVTSLAVSRDGTRMLSASQRDHAVILWDLSTGKILRRYDHHRHFVQEVAISPDGATGLSAGAEREVVWFDLATGRELQRLRGHASWIERLRFLPDGRRALSSDGGIWDGGWREPDDPTIRLWNLETGDQIGVFRGLGGTVLGLDLTRDGKRLLTGAKNGLVCLWDVDAQRELRRFVGHRNVVTGVSFLPDERTAISASEDGTLRFWDLESGEELRRGSVATDPIFRVAVSPDGRRALTSHGRKTLVRLWDLVTGDELYWFPGNTHETYSVTFLSNGQFALAAGGVGGGGSQGDYAIRLWRLP